MSIKWVDQPPPASPGRKAEPRPIPMDRMDALEDRVYVVCSCDRERFPCRTARILGAPE